MAARPLMRYVLTDHARSQMIRRQVPAHLVEAVMSDPEQRFEVRGGRHVLQSRFRLADGLYLFRVFADVDRDPAEVVTVYRTSRVTRYWRPEP